MTPAGKHLHRRTRTGTLATFRLLPTPVANSCCLPACLPACLACLQNVNYPGARTLFEKYRGQEGFNILAFSCNQVSCGWAAPSHN